MLKMKFELVFTNHANEQMAGLESSKDKKAVLKSVNKRKRLLKYLKHKLHYMKC